MQNRFSKQRSKRLVGFALLIIFAILVYIMLHSNILNDIMLATLITSLTIYALSDPHLVSAKVSTRLFRASLTITGIGLLAASLTILIDGPLFAAATGFGLWGCLSLLSAITLPWTEVRSRILEFKESGDTWSQLETIPKPTRYRWATNLWGSLWTSVGLILVDGLSMYSLPWVLIPGAFFLYGVLFIASSPLHFPIKRAARIRNVHIAIPAAILAISGFWIYLEGGNGGASFVLIVIGSALLYRRYVRRSPEIIRDNLESLYDQAHDDELDGSS